MQNRTFSITTLLVLIFCGQYASAQTQPLAVPQPQIIRAIDESVTVTMVGNVHPAIAAAASTTPADLGTPMQHMVLTLKVSAAQEAALETLLEGQSDPKSPLYHQYLTPQTYAALFGAAQSDINALTTWLQSHGMKVEQVATGNRSIVFSGTAGQVNSAFKTEIRQINAAGVTHFANATDPQIPAAFAQVVGGVVKLHNFQHTANLSKAASLGASIPQYTNGSTHYLTPADYGTIYDINPLYSAGVNGTGQTIAILARSDISLTDVQSFRSTFGLKANDPQFIVTGSDPGVLNGDNVETTLDTEWSGAVAPNATIKVIISASTNTTDGIDLAAQYAVNNNVAPVISLSYGSCEAGMGSSELAFYNNLWKQAASQGQTVLVSSGDSGAAGCDYGSSAQYGRNVNGLCSSPYSTCVGGTEFADTSNPGQYWLPGNNAGLGSAISYIPEAVWNESGANGGSGLWSGGGGASLYYAKPSWQAGPGVPADGKRDVPDVSMAAASHDGYFIAFNGGYYTVGGTSAAAPSFAGVMALVDQKTNARQGVANSVLYPLAVSKAAAFHDITSGNNSVPGATGYSATTGYDLASGLGSVDANVLVNQWAGASSTVSLALAASPASLNIIAGQTGQTTITTSGSTSFKAAVALSVTGAPAGMTATLSATSVASPGSGSVTLKLVTTSAIVPGTYSLTVTGTGDGQTGTVPVSVVVPVPTFTLTAGVPSLTVAPGNVGQVAISTTPQNGFSSTISLSVTGLPTGVTAAFSPATLTGSAAGASTLKLTTSSSTAAGTFALTIKGTSGNQTITAPVSLIIASPNLTLTSSVSSVSVNLGSTGQVTLTTTVQNGFNSTQAITVSGLPTGVIAGLAPGTIAATGGQSTLTLSVATTAKTGSYPLTITATGGGLSRTVPLALTVAPLPTCTIGASPANASVNAGSTTSLQVSCGSPTGTFSSPVAVSVSGAPNGMTATLAAGTLMPGATTALNIAAANTTAAGNYSLAYKVTGNGFTQTLAIPVTVAVQTPFVMTASQYTINAKPGTTTQLTATSTMYGGFSSAVAFKTTLPTSVSGITATLSQSSIPAPGTGSVTVTVNVASTVPAGTYALSVTGTPSGVAAATAYLSVVVASGPSFSLSLNTAAITIKQGGTGSIISSTGNYAGGFNGQLSVSITGLPNGMNYGVTGANAANNAVNITYTLTTTSTTAVGTYPITVTATGSGITHSATVTVTVTK